VIAGPQYAPDARALYAGTNGLVGQKPPSTSRLPQPAPQLTQDLSCCTTNGWFMRHVVRAVDLTFLACAFCSSVPARDLSLMSKGSSDTKPSVSPAAGAGTGSHRENKGSVGNRDHSRVHTIGALLIRLPIHMSSITLYLHPPKKSYPDSVDDFIASPARAAQHTQMKAPSRCIQSLNLLNSANWGGREGDTGEGGS
jgi:hypothetical protein